jgi:hypothetical protein
VPPQFIECLTDRGAIEPAFRAFAMRVRIPPPLQEDFNGQFLRAGLVVNALPMTRAMRSY